jgi:glucose/mannose transport system substrate-binding protein
MPRLPAPFGLEVADQPAVAVALGVAFNTRKGSIPARSDADPADYPAYLRAAIADFKRLRLVPSCAHGSACTRAQTVAAISAVGRFSSAGGVADLQAAIAPGVAAYRAGAVTR